MAHCEVGVLSMELDGYFRCQMNALLSIKETSIELFLIFEVWDIILF